MRPRPTIISVSTAENVCWRCSLRLSRQAVRRFSRTSLSRRPAAVTGPHRLKAGYFQPNSLLERLNGLGGLSDARNAGVPSTAWPSERTRQAADHPVPAIGSIPKHDLPHRRRQAARRNAASSTSVPPTPASSDPSDLPTNASTILSDVAARQPGRVRRLLSALLALSKPRLTVLVVLTAMAPYALYPVPAFLSQTALAEAPSLSPLTLLFLTTGTALCSASANTLNMLYEPSTDALMSRTRNRPLVRALVSRRAALLFAVLAGGAGVAALHLGVNPTVAFLGGANIALYAGVYTPMKRLSALNTWVGALVGGIPPLMGWAAAAGESATGDGSFGELLFAADGSSSGGWLLATLLFAWQFPHFMALSWSIRDEYRAAGLRMLSWVDPRRNARVALRYSLVFVPLSVALCAAGVTEWSFAATSLPVNAWLAREAVRFWRSGGHGGSARGLFWASVWHLPVIMVLALLQKKGMWQRVWRTVAGEPELEEEDDDYDDDEWEDISDDEGRDVAARPGSGPIEANAKPQVPRL